jgi:hypothetical protein
MSIQSAALACRKRRLRVACAHGGHLAREVLRYIRLCARDGWPVMSPGTIEQVADEQVAAEKAAFDGNRSA